jgi:hypothetical protein
LLDSKWQHSQYEYLHCQYPTVATWNAKDVP